MYTQGQFLEGKHALITGAAQGNGKAIAIELARLGCGLSLIDIQRDKLAAVVREIEAQDIRVRGRTADCCAVEALPGLVDGLVADAGPIDILVNNAGIIRLSAFPDVPAEEYDTIMNLNARAAYFMMQSVAPHMPEGGRIVNISSVSGIDGRTLSPPYAASKAALITMTKTVARAMAGRRITVNAIAPGMIDTPFHQPLDRKLGVEQAGLQPGEFIRERAKDIPLGRMGRADEVSASVAFLVSPGADYITGETLIISGGWMID